MEVKLWKDKGKKKIDPELFSLKAEELAKTIYKEKQQSRDRANKPTQIRKFYDEVIRFDGIVKANPGDFESLLPYIKMLNAKVAYANGRDLVSAGFKTFISSSLNQIQDKDDFDIFADFFEAFMGYYKYYDKKGDAILQGGAR